MRAFGTKLVALAMCAGALTACNTKPSRAPLESVSDALERVAPRLDSAAVRDTDEPGSYRIDFDVYFAGHTTGKVSGKASKRRRLLDATRAYRRFVRPFDEFGATHRTLGFARGAGGAQSRVTFLRPIAEDPRPRVYPPDDKPVGYRRVAGRVCASYVISGEEYCVDGAGLVLAARTHLSLQVAVKVTVGAQAASASQIAAPLSKGFTEPDRGSVRPVDPDSAPAGATDYSLDAPPDGFSLVGRYAVVPLSGEVLRQSHQIVAGIVDVYVRGADSVVVERGGKLDKTDVGTQDLGGLEAAHGVDLGALGAGQAGIAGVGPFGYREVRATPAPGRYLVVAGTLPEEQLLTIARALHAWPGTQLRYLDHPSA